MAQLTPYDPFLRSTDTGHKPEYRNIIVGGFEDKEQQPPSTGTGLDISRMLRMSLPQEINSNQVAEMARQEQARQLGQGNHIPLADSAIRTALLRLARGETAGGHGSEETHSGGLPGQLHATNQPTSTTYPQGYPRRRDPRTLKYDLKVQTLLDNYHENFVPDEGLPTDDVEHFCVCGGADDGRSMIECSNNHKGACYQGWFHLDCIGMDVEEIPDEEDDWYCERCTQLQVGRLRPDAPTGARISTKVITERSKNVDVSADESSDSSAVVTQTAKKQKGTFRKIAKLRKLQTEKKLSVQTTEAMSWVARPIIHTPKPWTAPLDKSLTNDPAFATDYNLNSLSDAKAALQIPTTAIDGDVYMSDDAAVKERSPLAGRSGGKSWSKEEDQHLIDVVKGLTDAGMCGENLWLSVQPMMEERGVKRTAAGMKMQWCRRLRIQTGIDERRKKNAVKMQTALQERKKGKTGKVAASAAKKNDQTGTDEDADDEMEDEEEELAVALERSANISGEAGKKPRALSF